MTGADAARAAGGLGPLLARSLAALALAAVWLRRVMTVAGAVSVPSMRVVLGAAGDLARYRAGRWRASLAWAALVWLGLLAENGDLVTAVALVSCGPVLVAGLWRRVWPVSFERVAAPVRRLVWWVWVRRRWAALARDCGLSVQRKRRQRGIAWQSKKAKSGGLTITQASDATEWVAPKLRKVTTSGDTLTLTVRTRAGQHSDDLEKAAPALAATCGAISHRVRVLSPFMVRVELVMREALASLRLADIPATEDAAGAGDVAGLVALTDGVPLGRRQDGSAWLLRLRGRHTLVVGCSGSGKGSLLWGIAAGLAPAVSADVVRLWGIDLKRGVEIGFGADLLTTTAYTRTDALAVLRRLVDVIAERGDHMAGRVRLHQPRPGDPLHVLVIDELATLTAYGDRAEREEANRLLAEIQSQGRALGVVVVAFVQDPRKDTVPTRSLFTQTVALRLRSASEVTMVLGDGMAALAPAHRVSPAAPGTGYLVDEDGTVDRVRADFWPDDLVRHVAASHPSRVREAVTAPNHAQDARTTGQDTQAGQGASVVDIADLSHATHKPRKPRSPRKPRASRADRTQART